MRFTLVRHGKTIVDREKQPKEWELSADGWTDCRTLGEREDFGDITHIFTSSQDKAIDTASAILLGLGQDMPIVSLSGLAESTSVTNGFIDEYEAVIRPYYFEGDRINRGETEIEVADRIERTIKCLAYCTPDADDANALIVAHANVLASLTARIDQSVDAFAAHQAIGQPDVAILDWQNGSGQFVQMWEGLAK